MSAVRKITKTEISLIAGLEKRCFVDPWSENFLAHFYDTGALMTVSENENGVTGYAVLDLAVQDTAELMRIAVLPEYRGRGISLALMQTLIDAAKANKKDKILLEVRETNTPAVALYKKFGFKTDGIRKNYYKNPTENGILMSLDLN